MTKYQHIQREYNYCKRLVHEYIIWTKKKKQIRIKGTIIRTAFGPSFPSWEFLACHHVWYGNESL